MFATKITGKPYAGKLHVRIDEGEKRKANTPRFSLLYCLLWFKNWAYLRTIIGIIH